MALSKRAYIKQISIYLENKEYEKSYPLAREMNENFPEDTMTHYLMASSAFWAGKYEESIEHGRKAFNMVKSKEDLIACALITSSSYYELKQYSEGFRMLKAVEKLKYSEDIETMMFVFSLALKDEKEAMKHAKNLQVLNAKLAEKLLKKFLKSSD
ncbi:hypothetical protein JXA56_00270 [Candidatus Micrarchaeota archaeon]|nr:hypothetical protein [Candidatus Micrarchaeota archaeon]